MNLDCRVFRCTNMKHEVDTKYNKNLREFVKVSHRFLGTVCELIEQHEKRTQIKISTVRYIVRISKFDKKQHRQNE